MAETCIVESESRVRPCRIERQEPCLTIMTIYTPAALPWLITFTTTTMKRLDHQLTFALKA